MKRKILLSIALFTLQITSAQVIYSENFDNLTVGNVGTDITGVIAGQGGWHTRFYNSSSNSDAYISNEINKGKIITLKSYSTTNTFNSLFLKDLDKLINQKKAGNNIIKVSFEFFTDSFSIKNKPLIVGLTTYSQMICNFWFHGDTRVLSGAINEHVTNSTAPIINFVGPGGSPLGPLLTDFILPINTWVTVEIFVDYNISKIYFSAPSFNLTKGFDVNVKIIDPLNPQAIPLDSEIGLIHHLFIQTGGDGEIKLDNFNISALTTLPSYVLSAENILAEKFNMFPNPASNIVNITNSENMTVQQVTIYDISGKQLSAQSFNKETEIQLNVENLSSGTYMLHIQSDSGTAVKKLIKK